MLSSALDTGACVFVQVSYARRLFKAGLLLDQAQDSGVTVINSVLWFNEMVPLGCSWERSFSRGQRCFMWKVCVCVWGVGVVC